MPLYEYHCKCGSQFQAIVLFADFDKYGKKHPCPNCKRQAQRLLSTGISGGSTAEPWEYEYTHKQRPKFVRDSAGHRHKFDPTKHTKGRKGQG